MEWKPPVIKARIERIEHPNGRVDIIAHIPKLEVMQAMKEHAEYKEKQKKGE